MTEPILTSQHAESINALVQQVIDPRLFLLCNYEPTIRHAISEDGIYQLNIQDLYKFAIDSTAIIKQYFDFIPKNTGWPDSEKWNHLKEQISSFRTVFDHNISKKDGQESREAMDAYLCWVRAVIKKPTPETLDDYKQLNEKLKEMAGDVRACFESFIRCAAANPDRSGVVDKWIDKTLYWYSNNTKTGIYKGYLIDYYTARAQDADMDVYRSSFVAYRGRNIKNWIASMKRYPIESKIRETEQTMDAYRRILSNPSLHSLLSPAEEANVRRILGEQEKKCAELRVERDRMEAVKSRDLENDFYKNLKKQLEETMQYLQQEGQAYTLLPQDLFGADMKRVFGPVPIPDYLKSYTR